MQQNAGAYVPRKELRAEVAADIRTIFHLGKPDPFGMPWFAPYLSPLAGLGVLAAALVFWNYGLRHYQSTGT